MAGLAPGAASTKTVTIPSATPFGTYLLLACADDTKAVAEADEGNNCLASAAAVTVARPDLVQQGVSNPAGPIRRGTAFTVSDSVANDSPVATPKSTTTHYCLSKDGVKSTGDTKLVGARTVPILAASGVSSGSASVTIPSTAQPGTYVVLACADDGKVVAESSEPGMDLWPRRVSVPGLSLARDTTGPPSLSRIPRTGGRRCRADRSSTRPSKIP